MIASLSGSVLAVTAETAVIEVGGVGLEVHCGPGTVAGLRVGGATRLATSLVVRDDSLTLYGFGTDDERSVFEILQGVSEGTTIVAAPGDTAREGAKIIPVGRDVQ